MDNKYHAHSSKMEDADSQKEFVGTNMRKKGHNQFPIMKTWSHVIFVRNIIQIRLKL